MRKLSWSPFNLLYLLMLMFNVFSFMLNSVLSIYAREYIGATIAEVGFIFAAWSIIPIITVPLIGLYLRGTQLLYAPAIASTILTISSLGMALASSPIELAFFRILQGLGNSFLWSPAFALITLLASHTERLKRISRATLANSIGMVLGPLIGSANIALFGIRSNFFLGTIIAFIGLTMGLTLVQKRERFIEPLLDVGETHFSTSSIISTLKTDPFKIAFSAFFATIFLSSIMTAYGGLYAKDVFKFSEEQVALTLFGYNLVLMFGRILLMRLLDHISKGRILLFGLVNGAAMLSIMTLSENYIFFTLAFSLAGLSHSLIMPVGNMIIAESTDRIMLTFTNALYMLSGSLGMLLGPLISAPIAQIYGIKSSFIIAVITISIVLVFIFTRRKEKNM